MTLYKALQYQFEPDFVYTVRINWGLRVDKTVVFTQLSQRKKKLFPGYFELSRVLECGSLSIRALLRVV